VFVVLLWLLFSRCVFEDVFCRRVWVNTLGSDAGCDVVLDLLWSLAGRNITVVAVSRVILHDDAVFAGRAALTKIMQYRSLEYRAIRRRSFSLTSPFHNDPCV